MSATVSTAGRAGKASRRASQPQGATARAATGDVAWLTIHGAAHNNLRGIDVAFPLGRFTCVTGVSGSGKSSLVNEILYKALARDLNRADATPGGHERISGLAALDKIIAIDQAPIGRTPRSNPATYIKVFDEIRALFAKLPDAKLRGYKPGRFSFNVAAAKGGGRCEACEGNGANRIEMDFLADVWVDCPVCEGRRFARETRQIQYKGQSIADVLEMDVQQALEQFDGLDRIRGMLQTLHDVGLDYIKLGQPAPTLSGGEAQRIKLARELVKKPTAGTIYVLDEPTTGLHFEDIRKLLAVLHGFVDAGSTVVVIEHNLDVVKTADWVIDLGPEGGEAGGALVVDGTPEEVAACESSHTGRALAEALDAARMQKAEVRSQKAGPKRLTERRETREAGADGSPSALRRAPFKDAIVVRGARQHNLKNIDVRIPRDQITVCTGVSGSGKTSFAIDTVFTEGYRRYVESLSAYARQFLGQMAKPRVEHIEGLSPAICIEQKAASKSPRSTVGTITEIYDYMRVLWARVGVAHCSRCQQPIGSQTIDEIVDRVMALDEGAPIMLLAPMQLGDGETYAAMLARLKRSGYQRVRIDGVTQKTAEAATIDARRKHRVEVVVDRTIVRAARRGRIAESVEHALSLGAGVMTVLVEEVERVDEEAESAHQTRLAPPVETRYSQKLACLPCGVSYEELSPHSFSFNSQLGWCETCEGLGVQRGAPSATIIKNPGRSLFDGAIAGWARIDQRTPMGRMLATFCQRLGVTPDAPLEQWSAAQRSALMFGADDWMDGADAFPRAEEGSRGQGAGGSRDRTGPPDSTRPLGPSAASIRFQWRGFFPAIDAATRNSWMLRHRLHNVVTDIPCVACRGGRLRPEPAASRLGGRTIVEVCGLPLGAAMEFFERIQLGAREKRIAGDLLHEIRSRLRFLIDVGLEYLTLHRAAPTLSGGEAQRIRLASQIGSGLSGVLYVLDEPTIGLHPRDTKRLVSALQRLRQLGNTLLLVEHDAEVIRSADRLIDFGPRAGVFGGEIVAEGAPRDFSKRALHTNTVDEERESLTRGYLSGSRSVPIPANRRPIDAESWLGGARFEPDAPPPGKKPSRKNKAAKKAWLRRRPAPLVSADEPARQWLVVRGARQNNLANIDVPIPLGRLVCVTGVSGSGKSSLVNDILWPSLARDLLRANASPGEHDRIDGVEALDKVVNVDQSPIGATPSSNPATYTGAFDWIRELFARVPEAKMRGYESKRFSFNRPGGRCEACEGAGQKRIEMHFMPDVWVTCEVCDGKRYAPETLAVRYKGKSIADTLEMSVAEALRLFENVPKVRRMLQTLDDVGLGYVQLGQPAPTLSGGEAQRVKLAAELGKPDTGRTLFLLDEPTTGLHFDDVNKLLEVMHRLVDLGNTVLVVEHNLDVIKSADWIIDLGPEAGAGGGRLVAMGTPEDVAGAAEARHGAGMQNAERGMQKEVRGSQPPRDGAEQRRAGRRRAGARGGAANEFAIRHSPFAIPSHTGAALRPVLEQGTRVARERYDPAVHAEREMKVERARLGDVGKETRMPWQVDGRNWHLAQRDDRNGKPRRWQPAALEYVEELIQKAGRGKFAPTHWSNRASVEITAPGAHTWFLHALTGGEWLLELYFRAPPGTFGWRKLDEELELKTLDQRPDIQAYGDWARVDVRKRRDGFDAIVVYAHDKAEIDTPAFRRFVRKAVQAYLGGGSAP